MTTSCDLGSLLTNQLTSYCAGGYDNAWVFDNWNPDQVPVPRLSLSSPLSGITVVMSTDQPSVQFYSGNFLDGIVLPQIIIFFWCSYSPILDTLTIFLY